MVFIRYSSVLILVLGWLPCMRSEPVLNDDVRKAVRGLAEGVSPRSDFQSDNDASATRLARVLFGMSRPPISKQDFEKYQTELTALAGTGCEIADLALYLRARLFQVHLVPADYEQAAALYLKLGARSPTSHWSQLGFVKLGLMRLYAPQDRDQGRDRLAEAEALLAMIVEPALKRDLHLQIGWAGLHYGWPLSQVIPHLKAADRVGGLMGMIPENLTIQIAELSFRNGETADARMYFERFLCEFPTSVKRYNVEQRLADVTRKEGEGR